MIDLADTTFEKTTRYTTSLLYAISLRENWYGDGRQRLYLFKDLTLAGLGGTFSDMLWPHNCVTV